MKTAALFLLLFLGSLGAQTAFDTHFEHRTMRIDLFHSGDAGMERFALDTIRCDGPWSGSTSVLQDPLDLGLYRVVVLAPGQKEELYTAGFASIFGEWQTTPEARSQWGTNHESLRIPWPRHTVSVRIDKRDAQNRFQPIWSHTVDPTYRQIIPTDAPSPCAHFLIWGEDDPEHRLDIVFLGDGYTQKEMPKFREDARRLAGYLLEAEPYRSLKDRITVRAVETPSLDSGVTRPHDALYRQTALSVRYSTFDSQRYALSMDNRSIRNAAATVPYDFTVIMMNERTYGGGGIYNLYATVAADNAFSRYIVIHEMGHHVAGLADEYYTSQVSYDTSSPITVEPWEHNVTAHLDGKVKWAHLISPQTPVPTPWDQETFDIYGRKVEEQRAAIRARHGEETEMENLFATQRQHEENLFASMKYRSGAGLFEGANYRAKGYYRSGLNCIMFTRCLTFCPVCRDTLAKVIKQYSH